MNPRPQRGRRRRPSRNQEKPGPRRERIEELRPTAEPPAIESFEEWDLGEEIQRAIKNMDITSPFPIQRLAIGPVLQGRDVIAKAETGTGKTLAFGAPMMSKIDPARSTVLALVLCPTRELAQQVESVLAALALPRGVKVTLVVGGDPVHPQIADLQSGAQVVVGTPGRVLDLYQQKFLQFPWAEYVVLDEADKMFEIGFLDDIKKILSYMPDDRQTLLFSATFPTEVLKLARAETKEPVEVATAVGTVTVEAIDQKYMEVDEEERVLALVRMLEQSGPRDIFLVFCERRVDVDRLMRRLERMSLSIKALHGGYDQAARFRVMSAFRTGEVKALVATDVASRGLDVQHVTHVINFAVPRDFEDYTHRIGRTGRAGRDGTAITLVTPRDRQRWSQIHRRLKDLLEEIDFPEATGRRPRRTEERERPDRKRSARRKPEHEQSDRDQPERGRRDRKRTTDEARPRRRRERERPERKRKPREEAPAAPPAPAADGPAPFGALPETGPDHEKAEKPKKSRKKRPRKRTRNEEPTKVDDPGAFGAGL